MSMPTVEVQLYYAGGLNDESIPIKATMQEHLLSNRISRDLADRLGHDTSGKGSVQISWRPPHRCMQYDQCDVIDEGPDKFVLCERCWRLCCETSKKAAYPTYRPFGPGTEPDEDATKRADEEAQKAREREVAAQRALRAKKARGAPAEKTG